MAPGHENVMSALFRNPPNLGKAAVRRYPRNDAGRDFVVGDIHGTFPELEAALERVGFDESRDRLFSVGDLVDRGPASADALDWMGRPWFHACRGNHEQMLIDWFQAPEKFGPYTQWPGCEWWDEVPEGKRSDLVRACRALPFAMEVETAAGPVGIVHANLPRGHTWDQTVKALEKGDLKAMYAVTWNYMYETDDVPDVGPRIRHVYCGHSVQEQPLTLGKVTCIDTGAFYGERRATARLTVFEFHPGDPPHPIGENPPRPARFRWPRLLAWRARDR